ncbi:twin-arginine translocase subunit TatC [Mesobacillus subterraneus]|uniref:twin-arginine translocase subunit TatC n=1 Tax=Mesobacillus subterraneus TaxID=285983 RepID=UPI0039AEF94B
MNEKQMNLVDHLSELRKRLMIIVGSFMFIVMLALIYVENIYHWLVQDLSIKLAVLGPSDILWVYLMLAAVIALAGTIPIAAHQIWALCKTCFIRKREKSNDCLHTSTILAFYRRHLFWLFCHFPPGVSIPAFAIKRHVHGVFHNREVFPFFNSYGPALWIPI